MVLNIIQVLVHNYVLEYFKYGDSFCCYKILLLIINYDKMIFINGKEGVYDYNVKWTR